MFTPAKLSSENKLTGDTPFARIIPGGCENVRQALDLLAQVLRWRPREVSGGAKPARTVLKSA
jgi:hypothetical protein